ncbi:MAG: 4-hydroxybenzoate octaprenyltransferase [Anaerolineaceae bacterium]|nr:4-hydroxybenzoate octaprenyltransferase [Anaerolineaceae bacterium]
MLARLGLVLETIKFSHTLFALPFAAVAAFWARGGWPRWTEAALLLVAMVAARTAAMAFNRVVDARLDALNPRTRRRAIPAGKLSVRSVAALALVAAVVFVTCALAFIPLLGNPWPGILCLPLLAVLCGYSYTKRFTVLSHYVLGLALGLSPLGVWIALTASVAWPPVLLGLAVMLWTAGFDILYSLQDLEHDRRVGLCSVPVHFGVGRAIWISRLNHAGTIVLLAALYLLSRSGLLAGEFRLSWAYLAGAAAMSALLVWEHRLVGPGDLSRLDRAFFTVNATGGLVFAACAVADVLL